MIESMIDNNCGQLLEYRESLANITTIHEPQKSQDLWLEIPRHIAKDLTLTQARELGLNPTDINIVEAIERDSVRPWLMINPTYLDFTPGFHMIQFIFRNEALNVYQSFYYSYMSQVDNPEKPYIYMQREDNT